MDHEFGEPTSTTDRKLCMNDHAPLLPPGADAETRRTAVYLVMSQIPPGKVVSYGELAAMAGLGRAARWVGRLSRPPSFAATLPWGPARCSSSSATAPASIISPLIPPPASCCARWPCLTS